MKKFILLVIIFCCLLNFSEAKSLHRNSDKKSSEVVMAYYTGNGTEINKYHLDELTHIIFSFVHLKNNKLTISSAADSITLRQLVALKKRYPHLKIMVSMGGWGGCASCSKTFSTAKGRKKYALSVKKVLNEYHLDGIDIDWEYPTIQGYPGHLFTPEDKKHVTDLFRRLRHTLGKNKIISFAAGGFNKYLRNAIDWRKVVPEVNYVNLMTYDLVNGYSKVTGLHTPLYSSPKTPESVDNAVRYLDSLHINMHKIVIGAAFYARVWKNVPNINHGLFQPGTFKTMVNYKDFGSYFKPSKGFVFYWNKASKAPWCYSAKEHLFGTFDNIRSVKLKMDYVKKMGLGGIMFWELTCDKSNGGLLDAIYQAKIK